ncbi:MAG: hypothetical protein F8N37_24200 [Telmatospirillum sp.]|nr:hypothetical protein [Telmatospirillum sp.]
MANVGTLIHTPQGLGTIVRVQPGHIDPALSKVVAEPLDQGVRDVLSYGGHGAPLPGQAASAANFIQTLILPSDLDVIAQADAATAVQPQADGQVQSQVQTVADSEGTEMTAGPGTTVATDQAATPSTPAPADVTGQMATPAPQQSFVQAVQAYNTVQQRLDNGSGSPVTIG